MTDSETFTESKNKMVLLWQWEPWPPEFEVQKNDSLASIIEILYIKQIFFETDSCLLALPTSTSQMQNCFKIDLGSIKLSNVWFHIWKPELFWWLSWNGAYLGVGSRTTKESNNDSQQVTRGHNKSKRNRNESKLIYKDSQWVKTDIQWVTTSQKRPVMTHKES